MKKIILTILCFLPILLASQSALQFKIGTEYRITPIGNRSHIFVSNVPVNYNEGRQLTGNTINFTLTYFMSNNFGFGISQSFQYSHIYYEDTNTTTAKSVNGIISDFKLFLLKEFYLNESKDLFLELGLSLMNNGTSYAVKEEVGIVNGNPVFITSDGDFNYYAPNLTFGLAYKKFDIGIGAFFIEGAAANFATEDNIILPYLKLNYIFTKKN